MKKRNLIIIIVLLTIVFLFILFHNLGTIIYFYQRISQKRFKVDPITKECTYEGKKVYYTISECCDRYNPIHDEDGKYICSPDGGFDGTGDGRCPDIPPECKSNIRFEGGEFPSILK